MHGTDQLYNIEMRDSKRQNILLTQSVEYSMLYVNYEKREQEKSLQARIMRGGEMGEFSPPPFFFYPSNIEIIFDFSDFSD